MTGGSRVTSMVPALRVAHAVFVVTLASLALASCTRLPNGPARAFGPPVRGVIVVDWTADGYAQPSALAVLDAIAAAGVNTVTFVVTGYQADAKSSAMRASDPRTPTAGAVRQLAEAAAARGLAVTLKPHVDLDDGRWRGAIEPPDPAAWFVAYRAFLLPWARLADSLDCTRFSVGTELAGTDGASAEWRSTIGAVRAVFTGQVVYAASWDEAQRVEFWDALDVVGVDFYYPVADRNDAGRFDLLAGWAPWLERLERLHARTGKRILLTEIGYRSVDGAGRKPYDYSDDAAIDLGEQADLYWAALQAVGDQPWMDGMDWWNWRTDGSGGSQNRDFTPYGKPAAAELSAAWTR